MDEFVFEDALAGSKVTCSFPGLDTTSQKLDSAQHCTSVFFPGCSLINYSLPLVNAVYDMLKDAGRVDGISILCCGKILEYEPNAAEVRPAFEQQFRDHVVASGITRIVAACPNCVTALRNLLAVEELTANVQVVPLVTELVEMGYAIDPDSAQEVAHSDSRIAPDQKPVFCVKDSCPDRDTGEFADGLRAIMPTDMIVDPEHNRKKSVCCGSRPRAVGKIDAALKCCVLNHEEAKAAGANAIVSACMSCTYLLSNLYPDLPVYHYLELLFSYRIPWEYADQYMKLRFLFESEDSGRQFQGLA